MNNKDFVEHLEQRLFIEFKKRDRSGVYGLQWYNKFAGTGLGMSIAKTIPIIAMTANAFTEDRLKAKEAGMNEHIVKPVDVELLIKVIHKLMEYN